MERYTIDERVLIVKHYYQNGESPVATIRKVRPIFGRNNIPNSSTVKRIIEKFETTGSVMDVKHTARVRSGRSEKNITAVRESVTEKSDTSIRRRAQELGMSTATLHRILTKDLQLDEDKVIIIENEGKSLEEGLAHSPNVSKTDCTQKNFTEPETNEPITSDVLSGINSISFNLGKVEKMFSCEICEKRFTRKSHVDIHMRIHANIRPHICNECGRGFTKSGDLSRHKKVHSNRKDFICELCGKAFKRATDVTSHMNSHTGQKPYKCKMCDKAYTSHSSMMKHCRSHGHLKK